MKIYLKILLTVLPMTIIAGLGAFAITSTLSRQALTEQTQNLLMAELNKAINITSGYNQLLVQYGLGDAPANVRQAQFDAASELRQIIIGENGFILAVDAQGAIVSYPDASQIGLQVDEESWFQMMRAGQATWQSIDFNGSTYLAKYQYFPDWDWYILAVEPETDVFRPIGQALNLGILLITLVSGIILALLAWRTRLILYPLQLVSESAMRIGQGEYDIQIPVKSKDEVGQLAAAFNQMAAQIKENISALGESEERFKRAVIESPIPMLIHDEDDHNLTISKGWTKFSGYTLEDIPTMGDWTQHAYGERSGFAKEYIDDLFEINETVSNGEWIINTKNGEKRVWDFYTTPIGKISDGKRTLLSLAVDITQRKLMDDKLRESEARLNTILESSLVAIGISRLRDGKIIYINTAFENLYGYLRAEILDRTTSELGIWAIPADRQRFIDLLETEREVRAFETIAQLKSGEERHVLVSGRVVDIDNEPCLMAQIVDITERRRAEESLRKSQGLLRETESIGNVGGWEFDIDTMEQTWTEQVYQIHEVDLDFNPTVNSGIEFYAPEARVIVEKAVQEAIEFGKSYDLELPFITAKGNHRWVHAIGTVDLDHRRVHGFFQDITKRKQAEQQVLQLTRLYAVLSQVNQTIVRVKNPAELYQSICDVTLKFGELQAVWIGLLDESSGTVQPVAASGLDLDNWPLPIINLQSGPYQNHVITEAFLSSRVAISADVQVDERTKNLHDLTRKFGFHSLAVVPFQLRGKTIGVLNMISLEMGFFNADEELHLLEEMGLDISFALDTIQNEMEREQSEIALQESEEKFRILTESSPVGVFLDDAQGNAIYINERCAELVGLPAEEALNLDWVPSIHPDDRERVTSTWMDAVSNAQPFSEDYRWVHPDGRVVWTHGEITPVFDSQGELSVFIGILLDITDRKQAEKALTESEEKFRKAFMTSPDSININRLEDGLYVTINQGFTEIMGYTEADVIGKTSMELNIWENQEDRQRLVDGLRKDGFVSNLEARFRRKNGGTRYGLMSASIIDLDNVPHILSITRDITQRKQAEKQIQQQLKRLNSLHTIDIAISSSFDQKATFSIILDQVISELSVDTCSILLFNAETQTLEHAASRGFRSKVIPNANLKLNEGFAGQVMLKRQTLHISDLMDTSGSMAPYLQNVNETFSDYFGTPLVVKGEIKGVMEIYHRSPLYPEPEWLSFLETLATQTAIAIDNAQLFTSLQSSNLELSIAYDATIEGWSRAMDLRDKETEGHTERVTELALQLARAMNYQKTGLINIRRGSLLHDMGKLGVPDHILFKPGKLTAEEWDIMRQHPQFAYDMLSKIRYIRPALEIPYCHHERWDGTGYPRGLKEYEIPLSARIFAVVDVWDAVTSERPYRKAWTEEQAVEYIETESGKHFDPQVVGAFLNLINKQ